MSPENENSSQQQGWVLKKSYDIGLLAASPENENSGNFKHIGFRALVAELRYVLFKVQLPFL